MAIRIVQLGTPRERDEGPRLGTVRRPPRGVPRSEFARQDWFDAWLPNLSPSQPLVRLALGAKDDAAWRQFDRRFTTELRKPEASHLLDALATLSHAANFSIGCYCEDERRCHRAILRRELRARGAAIR